MRFGSKKTKKTNPLAASAPSDVERMITGVPEDGGGGAGILNQDFLENMLGNANMPSIAKEFVHPGNDTGELLMRSIFKNERQANAAVEYYARCVEFNDQKGQGKLLNWLASRPSINGIARKELAQVLTGKVLPTLYGKKDGREQNNERKREEL